MENEFGVSLYYRRDKLRLRYKLLEALGTPDYVHLYIQKEQKKMYIEACGRDNNAFLCQKDDGSWDGGCYINSKILLQFLSNLMGEDGTWSVRLTATVIQEGLAEIDLEEYEHILPEESEESVG